jgi:hypothetical protein
VIEMLEALLAVLTLWLLVAPVAVPVVLIVRVRRRTARAWRAAEHTAMWEPRPSPIADHYRVGVEVNVQRVARLRDAERPLGTPVLIGTALRRHSFPTVETNPHFQQELEDLTDQARDAAETLNTAKYAT